jgi:O-antigen ligase
MIFVLVSFIPMIDVSKEQIGTVFLCSLVYFVLAYCLTAHGGVRLLQILESGTGSGLESGYDNHQGGLVGPIYAVFLYAIGAKTWFLLALVMSLLGGKRVGVLAIIVGLVFVYLFKEVPALKEKRNRFIVLLGALAIINVLASNLISVSEYEYERLGMDTSIEEIMLGRYAIGSEMNRAMDNRSLIQSLVGSGPGGATALAIRVSDGELDHPHNDWLRIVYDYGIFGSLLITVFLALVFANSATGAVIAITNAIIMMTDNVIMYLHYQLPIALMLAYSAQQERRALSHSSC